MSVLASSQSGLTRGAQYCFDEGRPDTSGASNNPSTTMALDAQNASPEGLSYFLHRAAAMTLQDARNLLNLEITRSDPFHSAWNSAVVIYLEKMARFPSNHWNWMPPECYIAVICYTVVGQPSMGRQLNTWCRNAQPTESSWQVFPLKSFWCFLVRAFVMLPPFATGLLYRGVRSWGATPQNSVFFSQFVSATLSCRAVCRYAMNGGVYLILISVPPLLVRDISLYSMRENEREVLIWPFCTFKVFQITIGVYLLYFCGESPPRHLPILDPTWPWTIV